MAEIFGIFAGLGFLAMIGTLGYQAFLFLKYGEWIGLGVTYACGEYLKWDWCNFPENWVGVHKILSMVNVGVFIFAATLLAACFVAAAGESRQ
jgi:hypothetical protein